MRILKTLCILLVITLMLASCAKGGKTSTSSTNSSSDEYSYSSDYETNSDMDGSSETDSSETDPSKTSSRSNSSVNGPVSNPIPIPESQMDPDKFYNTKGTKVVVNPIGKEITPSHTAPVYNNYTPGSSESGPTGATSKDVLYILLADHTDDHGGRIGFSGTSKNQIGAMQLGMNQDYPGFNLGNQYGGNYYEYVEKQGLIEYPQGKQNWDKFMNMVKSNKDYSIVGGTYSQALSGYMLEEPAILQFQYGLEAIKKYTGKTVKYYAHSENTAFSFLPQILNDFGYEGAITRTHWQVVGYPPAYNKSFGLWMGPDGSAIKTVTTFAGDNIRIGSAGMNRSQGEVIGWFRNSPSIGLVYTGSLIRQANIYYNDKKKQGADYVICTVVEDTDFTLLRSLYNGIKKVDPGFAKYKFVTAEQLFNVLQVDSQKSTFRMTPNQWQMTWNSGFYGNILNNALAKVTYLVDSAEKLISFAKLANISGVSDNRASFDESWKDIVRAEAHDAHIVPETTWVALNDLYSAKSRVDSFRGSVEKALTSNVNTKFDGDSLIIYNTQSFDRSELVVTKVTIDANAKITAIKEAASGKSIPFDITSVSTSGSKTTAVVTFKADVPGFGHNTYNIITAAGKTETTLKRNTTLLNAAKSSKATLKGKGFTLSVSKDGTIGDIILDNGTKIIDSGSGAYQGRFHPKSQPENGTMKYSTASVVEIVEGATLYIVTTSGNINNQEFTVKTAVYKSLPYIDFNTEYTFTKDVCIGNYLLSTDADGKKVFFSSEAWSESNENSRRERLVVNYNMGFKLGNNKDPFDPTYNLYNTDAYNKAINVARYTPYWPEEFKRETDANTLNSWPTKEPNHIYDIFSKYWIDISNTAGTAGLTMLTEGNGAYVYDGNMLSYVLAKASPASSLNGFTNPWGYKIDPIDANMLGLEGDTFSSNFVWNYRFIPHTKKLSTTEYTLPDGTKYDSVKEGLAYNNPLYPIQVKNQTSGSLPEKHRYLLADTGTTTVTNTLRTIGNNVFARTFEYASYRWADARFVVNKKSVAAEPVSMDMKTSRKSNPKYLDPYKIATFKIK